MGGHGVFISLFVVCRKEQFFQLQIRQYRLDEGLNTKLNRLFYLPGSQILFSRFKVPVGILH